MNYLLITIIGFIIVFIITFILKNKNRSSLSNKLLKTDPTKQLIDNDKQILIDYVDYNLIRKAAEDFKKSYSSKQQTQLKLTFRLHRVNSKMTIIAFPYDIDFEIFCKLINYLKYPEGLAYKTDIRAWTTTKSIDKWVNLELESKNIMLFLDPNDKEYDNIMLITSEGQTYKILFGINDEFQKTDKIIFQYKGAEFTQFELDELVAEDI